MSSPALPPGFRFHPTDEELILHYLRNRAASIPCPVSIIAEVDIYKFDPWDLPKMTLFGDKEWYFFSPRDRKYPNGIRPNRAAASGYWKATGTDKPIVTSKGNESIGVKKALVFYQGKPPKGIKTDWIMHEYRITHSKTTNTYKPKLRDSSMRLDDWVLCRIYKKSSHAVSSEPEDSSTDDLLVLNTPTHNTTINNNNNNSNNINNNNNNFINTQEMMNPLRLPKACSLTELLEAVDCSSLSRLLDVGPPGIPEHHQQPLFTVNNHFINNGFSDYSSENVGHFKRQRRIFEDNNDVSQFMFGHQQQLMMNSSQLGLQ